MGFYVMSLLYCVLPSVAIKRMASSYLHINVQMATIVGILTIISRPTIKTISECYEKKNRFLKLMTFLVVNTS